MSVVHKDNKTLSVPSNYPERPRGTAVLMVEPDYYDVLYEINPHMVGNIGSVDTDVAKEQWNSLRRVYESIGYTVHILKAVPELPDMVFAANQTFPFVDGHGRRRVILSKMASEHRQPEVPHFARWYEQNGFDVIYHSDPPIEFEGMGDAIWHPGRRLLYIGYGYRTKFGALQRAANCIHCDVIGLELINPHFYHLDTALSVINETTAIYVPEAFNEVGESILQTMFERLIAVPLSEAKDGFVTNGHSPNGTHFIVNKGNAVTISKLREIGIEVIEVDTAEFLKSGGSVFCMKMMLP